MAIRLAYSDGHFVPEDQARVSRWDRGFTWGATVTDRCRTYCRKFFRLSDHLARLRRSCDLCAIPQPIPDAELELFARHLLEQNGPVTHPESELELTVLATPGEHAPLLAMFVDPLNLTRFQRLLERGASVVTLAGRQLPNSAVPRQAKMRSRMHWWLAEQAAREIDPDSQALLLNPDGTVTETAIANFAIVRGNTILTPPRSEVLDGISMRVVEEICPEIGLTFEEMPLTLGDLAGVDEAILTSTPFGVVGVSSINRQRIPWPGPVLGKLWGRWTERASMDIWQGIRRNLAGY